MTGEIGYFNDPTDYTDKCDVCGAEPMTVQCNNADCWDRVVDNEPTEDEDEN